MGIEVVLIVVIVGIAGFFWWRQRQTGDAVVRRKRELTETGSNAGAIDDDSVSLTGAVEDAEDGYTDDKKAKHSEPEPKPTQQDDRLTSTPGTPSTSPPAPAPAPPMQSPQEIEEWMQDIANEKMEMEEAVEGDAGEDMAIVGDIVEEEEPTLDITYPDQQQGTVPATTTAHFSAFYPQDAQVGQRYSTLIYAHTEELLLQVQTDAQKFEAELGGDVPEAHTAKQSKALAHGSQITVELESDELVFEPAELTKTWHGDWTRFQFEFRPDIRHVDETAFVRASIRVLGFEIARIQFAVRIMEPDSTAGAQMIEADPTPMNPYAAAKMQHTSTGGYEKIFISYSRKDTPIATLFKMVQEATGHDVFFDKDDIPAGADWKAEIARAIDEADFMQVFWSEHSANSEWCQFEWDYALEYKCKPTQCKGFIRPVYWTADLIDPHPTLAHLNFKRLKLDGFLND